MHAFDKCSLVYETEPSKSVIVQETCKALWRSATIYFMYKSNSPPMQVVQLFVLPNPVAIYTEPKFSVLTQYNVFTI